MAKLLKSKSVDQLLGNSLAAELAGDTRVAWLFRVAAQSLVISRPVDSVEAV